MKVVYDTCLYIDLLRDGRRLDLFQHRGHIRYLSPIVVLELNAGARSGKQQAILDRLYRPYASAGRIPRLGNEHLYKAGQILAKLKDRSEARRMAQDVLIALGAHSLGATLFTAKHRDFEAIRRHLPVKVALV